MNLLERLRRWQEAEAEKLRPMTLRKRLQYILYYYRFWIMGLVILLAVGFYIGDAVVQSHKEILLQGFFTNDEYNLFPAGRIGAEYADTQDLTRQQRIVFDDVLYIDMGGQAADYTAASNGKLIAYIVTQELDFVVTSDEVLEYYKDELPMLDLSRALPQDLRDALAAKGAELYANKNEDGTISYPALDMTQSRYIAGEDLAGDPDIQHTYYLFVPASAPHLEQIIQFIRYSFAL
ncbi:MAG: hypothetical protein ACI4JC_08740 [Faecalibacterium sp.]